jgi:membrane dipeptidase
MLIFDGHLDLGWNAIQWERDLRAPAFTIRAQESHMTGQGRGVNTVSLPDMHRGRVALCFATTMGRNTGVITPGVDFRSAAQAHAVAMSHIQYYRALEVEGLVRVITDIGPLDAHVAEWQAWEARGGDPASPPPLGFILTMESADPILRPDQAPIWQAAGVTAIGPAHFGPGRYAGGTGTDLPLTPLGVELVREMDRLGIALDTTHLTDPGFWQALDLHGGPMWASHNNCRAVVSHQRQFTDDQLQALIARDGVIGAAFDIWMLVPGYQFGKHGPRDASLNDVVNNIDHVCQLAGDARHAAIGSDLDGGFGRDYSPHDLDTIADLQRIPELLSQRNYRDDDISAIMHGNWLRIVRRAWSRRPA